MRLRYSRIDHTSVIDEDSGEEIDWDPNHDAPFDILGEIGQRWTRLGSPKPSPYEEGPDNS